MLHRDDADQPAKITPNWNGVIGMARHTWYRDGKRHRDGGLPAIVCDDGTKEWYVDGERHRDDDLPAVEDANGNKQWFQHGKRHRDGDKPAAEASDGRCEW